MLENLTATCENEGCERRLHEDDPAIVYRADGCERRAYECVCGAVTITVHR